jgi:acetyltransferase-like isoleucine patch superfamily enzyme
MTGVNNRFSFGKGNVVNNSIGINFWGAPGVEPHGSEIVIGDYNYFNGSGNSIIGPLTTKIKIGNKNLFAGNIVIWGRNDHIIYDIETRKRLNADKDIDLGSSNWICEKVTVLPGASLGENSVLGLGSVLNKPIKKNNVLIAGVPAVIKKEGINWSRACNYDEVDFDDNINLKRKD